MSRDICYYHVADKYSAVIYSDGKSAINNDNKKEHDSNFFYNTELVDLSTLDPTKYICENTYSSGTYYINKDYIEKVKDITKKEYNTLFIAPEPKYDKNGNCISGDYIPRARLIIEENGSFSLVIPKENNTATKYIFSCRWG